VGNGVVITFFIMKFVSVREAVVISVLQFLPLFSRVLLRIELPP